MPNAVISDYEKDNLSMFDKHLFKFILSCTQKKFSCTTRCQYRSRYQARHGFNAYKSPDE
jgi:hypothetical protein